VIRFQPTCYNLSLIMIYNTSHNTNYYSVVELQATTHDYITHITGNVNNINVTRSIPELHNFTINLLISL